MIWLIQIIARRSGPARAEAEIGLGHLLARQIGCCAFKDDSALQHANDAVGHAQGAVQILFDEYDRRAGRRSESCSDA